MKLIKNFEKQFIIIKNTLILRFIIHYEWNASYFTIRYSFLTLLKIHKLRMCPKKTFYKIKPIQPYCYTRVVVFVSSANTLFGLVTFWLHKENRKNIRFCAFGVSVSRRWIKTVFLFVTPIITLASSKQLE